MEAENIKAIVKPDLYTTGYYLSDNEGYEEYQKGLENNIHKKFTDVLEIACPKPGQKILDIGCGRGELLYYCARRGAQVLGIDYSVDAITIARETIGKLPEHQRTFARADVGNVTDYNFPDTYDSIFMLEIFEHMHDWQLHETFARLKDILHKDGMILITTPNYLYEKYFYPIKRICNIPWNCVKYPLRIVKGKYHPKSLKELIKKIFKIFPQKNMLLEAMHVNVSTPYKIKKILSDYNVTIHCCDHSKNILTIISKKWFGRHIIAIAKKK